MFTRIRPRPPPPYTDTHRPPPRGPIVRCDAFLTFFSITERLVDYRLSCEQLVGFICTL